VLALPRPLPGSRIDAVVDERAPMPPVAPLRMAPPNEHLVAARQLATQNPAAVAGILRGWVDDTEPAAR